MRRWSFAVTLDPKSRTPVFAQIARALADDVARGRLRPGDVLPGSRTLALALGVHRSTVVAAYEELRAQGWVLGRPGAATAIAPTSPDVAAPRAARRPRTGVPAEPGFILGTPSRIQPTPPLGPGPPGTIPLWGGVPDVRLVPATLLGRALRRVTRLHGRALLEYTGDRGGHPRLRAELARMLSATRALAAGPDDVFVTQGSQLALYLVARALVQPGDVAAVEAIGYRPAWGALERAGARLVPIPVDGEGLDVEALARVARQEPRLRALHVTPQHHYPTTVVLSPRRRAALLELAASHRFAIVEDDYDHEFHFDGRPTLPLASADRHGVVVYVGSLAKILAPGLRIGFVVAPRALLARLGEERAFVDRQGCQLVEAAVAELLEDGEVERHARRARRIYQRRRDVLVAALGRQLPDALAFAVPPGGMALWARAAPGIDVDRWQRRALAAGVLFQAGRAFTFDGSPAPFVRLGFAVADERELETAVKRLARSLG